MVEIHKRKASTENKRTDRDDLEPLDETVQEKMLDEVYEKITEHARYVKIGLYLLCSITWVSSCWMPVFWSFDVESNRLEDPPKIGNLDIIMIGTNIYSSCAHLLAIYIGNGSSFDSGSDLTLVTPTKSTSQSSQLSNINETKMKSIAVGITSLPLFLLWFHKSYRELDIFQSLPNPWLPLLGNCLTMFVAIILRSDVLSNYNELVSLQRSRYHFKSV